MRTVKQLLNICAALTILVSVAQLFPGEVHIFQLLEAFQLQTIIGSLSLFVISVSIRAKLPAVIFLSCVGLVTWDTHPYVVSEEEPPFSSDSWTMVHANLWHHNTEIGDATTVLVQRQASIVLVQEVNEEWADDLSKAFEKYPEQVLIPHPECCYGIGLFSKFPILNCDTINLENTPALIATIQMPQLTADVVYIHTRPPAFPNETAERNNQLLAAANIISGLQNPWILAGDLNVVPWAEPFQKLMAETGGIDARTGATPTFPADPFPLIPIDHLIHHRDLSSDKMETFDIPGSDHLGISVRFH